MNTNIHFNRFFAFSEINNKYFYTEFSKGVNIIYGKNTSGKSTLIQSILYTFGINDEKHKLNELLKEKVIFRIDFTLKTESTENITFIRDGDLLVVKRKDAPLKKFIGIGGNSANEHKELKEYLGSLFGFSLFLESNNQYKQASIEAMFLPYYISQDVGWVYRHKSFRGLDFIKNFKTDFFDYFLGIKNDYDRNEKKELDDRKKELENELKFLSTIENKTNDFQLSKLKDEKYIFKSIEYLEKYKANKSRLIELEKDYIIESNKLTYLEQRRSVLSRVIRALKNQAPLEDSCPTCNQPLPKKIEEIYEYYQDLNDTEKQLVEVNSSIDKLKKVKSKINSLQLEIDSVKLQVFHEYSILDNYRIDDLTFTSWIDNKANVQLSENILKKIGEKTIELNKINEKLVSFKTDEELAKERRSKEYTFKRYFENYLSHLGVKEFDDNRFLFIYKIPAFPKQGVELLKTLLAYNFAFNLLIKETSYVHRLPFMLDAIFKEDIDEENRLLILKFVHKFRPKETQTILSIANSKGNKISAQDYNRIAFNNEAKLICIGDNIAERAFLSPYKGEHDEYLNESLSILEHSY